MLSSRRMPSPRLIGKLLVAMLMAAALGHFHDPAFAGRLSPITIKHAPRYQETSPVAGRSFAEGPSRQKGTGVKRHKRVLISKVFRPGTTVIFLKKYRVIESFTDYSSPHVQKRAIVVSSLRGPPIA